MAKWASVFSFVLAFAASVNVNIAAESGRTTLPGYVPAAVEGLAPTGRLPEAKHLSLAIGLPLRNEDALDELIGQLYDPGSTNFHKFLTPQEFTERFGPTEQDYQSVKDFAEANGLTVVGTHPNRVVLDVAGSGADVERAFHVTLRTYRHPTEGRDFFAPDTEPSVPLNLPVADMWGLSDYGRPRPLAHPVQPLTSTPLNSNGTGPGGAYQGGDFRNAYAPGTNLRGNGQIAAVAEFDGYYANDITTYEAQSGYTNVPLQNVLVDSVSGTPGYSGVNNAVAEVSLDIELIIAMAPSLTKLIVYEGNSPYDVFNRIVTDNTAKQISCSWAFGYGPTHAWIRHNSGSTLDSQLKQMATQGQSFFQASGDSDAYTGSQSLSSSGGPVPVDSIYVTCVGGTSLTMNGAGASWSSETAWNWGNNTGSGGGVSPNYTIPSWQTNTSMAANSGSTANRNIPDVALTADAVEVVYNNGGSAVFGGTSCAAPLWAGFCALVNQQALATGGTLAGFLNPALYTIANGPNYNACFHDITTGNNIGTHTAGLYNAVPGFDLATGLGTPNGTNLINALAPPLSPFIVTQPASQTVTNGANVTLSASVSGKAPLTYRWLFNGANLSAGGNVSGTTSNVLSITAATTNNAGNYNLVASNATASVTSSVAILSVGFAPAFSAQPTNLIILSGSNALLSAAISGSIPLSYQWRKNGTNLANGAGISGATTNALTLTGVTTNSAGNYTLAVANIFGGATSSVAALTVVLPPAITGLTNRTIECGSNVSFTVTATGTSPLSLQWSLDGTPVSGATSASLSLSNVHLPNHTVSLTVTNPYAGLASNAVLTVHDTLPPLITLNGGNLIHLELGSAFIEPGATATDLCAGTVAVSIAGSVSTNVVGTNTLIYTANDASGNTNSAARTVIVRDTTPPSIVRSFTNLVLAAGAGCSAVMPDVTGTNFILATDLSSTVIISQSPTNNAQLQLGTNTAIITVQDASGNAAYSTNTVVVQDQTPPQISSQPQSQTNLAGSTASFSVSATACTPVAFQWLFADAALPGKTNSTLTISNLTSVATGNYSVVATASGGSTTSSVATLTVNLNPTSLALDSFANPAGYGENLSFTATVTPASATGTIQFQTNGADFELRTLASGQTASTNLSTLPRGTNFITAIYSGDANDLPATNTLAQIITNHPPTALPAFCTRAGGAPLSITLSGLATNWSDADGDNVSLAAVSVSTNGVTLTNNGAALVYFNANNVPDQFFCTLDDGWGGTNIQAVNLTVAFPSIAGIAANPNGSFTLNLNGVAGYTFVLETTTDLLPPANWQPLATNAPSGSAAWQFTDSQTASQQRFYRLKLAP